MATQDDTPAERTSPTYNLVEIPVLTAADVTDKVIDEVWEITDGFYQDGPVDWEDVWDRMERGTGYDFGGSLDSPAIRKIQRVIREARKAS